MYEALVAGFLIGLTHAVPPGPITFEVLKRGVLSGYVEAFKVNAGAVAADAIYFILIMIGLVQLINNPTGKLIMWISGCLLLVFLGLRGSYKVLAGKGNYNVEVKDATGKKEIPSFLSGFSICITSPFALIWWTGVFASSMAVDLIGTGMDQMLFMFGGIALACLAWYGLVGIVGSISRRFMNEAMMKAMSLLCSVMMIAFAAILFYRGYTTLF